MNPITPAELLAACTTSWTNKGGYQSSNPFDLYAQHELAKAMQSLIEAVIQVVNQRLIDLDLRANQNAAFTNKITQIVDLEIKNLDGEALERAALALAEMAQRKLAEEKA